VGITAGLFSTVGGIAIVDPKSLPIQSNPPDVFIEEELLDQRPASPENGVLSVMPRQANPEIHYTAIGGYKPEQISFRYELVGLERNWVDAGTRRTAYYSHLPSGDYEFRVIAGNSSGVWNRQGRQLHIFVPAPFYLRRWFVTLMAVTAAGLMILVWQYRMGQIKRAHAAQQAFSRQLIASQESERKRIAAELHDSLGQRLVVIKNLAAIFLNSRDGQRSPADGNVEEIVSEASEALGEVKEISYNLHAWGIALGEGFGLTKKLRHARIDDVAPGSNTGLGVVIQFDPRTNYVISLGHAGSEPGYSANVQYYTCSGAVWALLGNGDGGTGEAFLAVFTALRPVVESLVTSPSGCPGDRNEDTGDNPGNRNQRR
jgi:hypothetical protein